MRIIVGSMLFSLLICLMDCGQANEPPKNVAAANIVRESPTQAPAGNVVPKTAGERGTPDEAKAMMQEAVEHYNQAGREQALKDFNTKTPPFGDRDLYVACVSSDHRLIANGGYPELVGTSGDAWKDADGHPLGKAIDDAMSQQGEATIKYRWYNPVSKKIEAKTGFFHRVGSDICGVGAYNP